MLATYILPQSGSTPTPIRQAGDSNPFTRLSVWKAVRMVWFLPVCCTTAAHASTQRESEGDTSATPLAQHEESTEKIKGKIGIALPGRGLFSSDRAEILRFTEQTLYIHTQRWLANISLGPKHESYPLQSLSKINCSWSIRWEDLFPLLVGGVAGLVIPMMLIIAHDAWIFSCFFFLIMEAFVAALAYNDPPYDWVVQICVKEQQKPIWQLHREATALPAEKILEIKTFLANLQKEVDAQGTHPETPTSQ